MPVLETSKTAFRLLPFFNSNNFSSSLFDLSVPDFDLSKLPVGGAEF
jgi:hypothetical protein